MRVNVDSDMNVDSRFDELAALLGIDPDSARWKCVRVYFNCYSRLSPILRSATVDAAAKIDGFAAAMVATDLASWVTEGGERVVTARNAAESGEADASTSAKRLLRRPRSGGDAGAERVPLADRFVRVSGVAKRIRWLELQAERGAAGGNESVKSRKNAKSGEADASPQLKRPLRKSDSERLRKPEANSPAPAPSTTPAPAEEGARDARPASPAPGDVPRGTFAFLDALPDPEPEAGEGEPQRDAAGKHPLVAAREGFHALYLAAHNGAKPTWGGREIKKLEGFLKRCGGVEEFLARARRMFESAPKWPADHGGDLDTLMTHYDKFAAGGGAGARGKSPVERAMEIAREEEERDGRD